MPSGAILSQLLYEQRELFEGRMRQGQTLFYPAVGRDICDRAIFISGNARSGTTILGKLVHSLESVEYVFEPPMLFALLPASEAMPADDFKMLFEAYCTEELLLGQLTGRAFNFNKNDDSYIGLTKSNADIQARVSASWTKQAAMQAVGNARLALKLPDMTFFFAALRRHYPAMSLIVTYRAANPVIQSILQKGWMRDSSLREGAAIWPSQVEEFCTPFWVERENFEGWRRWSELERAGYYYARIAEGYAGFNDAIRVDYDQLIDNARDTIAELAQRLRLRMSGMTEQLIASVSLRTPSSEDHTSGLPPALRRRVQQAEESSRS